MLVAIVFPLRNRNGCRLLLRMHQQTQRTSFVPCTTAFVRPSLFHGPKIFSKFEGCRIFRAQIASYVRKPSFNALAS